MSSDIFYALIGGVLIGLSATLLLRFNGKIAGISGILEGGLFEAKKKENHWKFIFLLGLLAGGALLFLFYPNALVNTFDQSLFFTALGGLLVGFGTRLGSGCTSGHGVCGVSRLSLRSIVATITFIGAGVIAVAVLLPLFSQGVE